MLPGRDTDVDRHDLAPAVDEQRMARVGEIEPVGDDLGFDTAGSLGEDRARIERVQLDHRLEGKFELAGIAAGHRGQRGEYAMLFRLGFALEHHHSIVQLDRPHRLDEQRLARDRAVLHDTFEPFGVVELERQHKAAVADGDDKI